MPPVDSYVQVAPDGAGKKTATLQVTRVDGSTVVEVQEVLARAEVSDTPPVLIAGEIEKLSMTPDGRLRVSALQAVTYLDFFGQESFAGNPNIWSVPNPWEI